MQHSTVAGPNFTAESNHMYVILESNTYAKTCMCSKLQCPPVLTLIWWMTLQYYRRFQESFIMLLESREEVFVVLGNTFLGLTLLHCVFKAKVVSGCTERTKKDCFHALHTHFIYLSWFHPGCFTQSLLCSSIDT